MGILINAEGTIVQIRGTPLATVIPEWVLISLSNFLLDKPSGSFTLEIQDGVVRRVDKRIVERP